MTWHDLIQVRLTQAWGIEITLGFVLVLAFLVVPVAYFLVRLFLFKRGLRFHVVEAEVSLGNFGSLKIRPSYEEIQIAHKAWTELATRKAALAFDEENDVIVEVYRSWYELFSRMRDLVKEIPAQKLRASHDTRELVRLLVSTLNCGLRPHLTKWQAKFRRWYEAEALSEVRKGVAPQVIQRDFPEYEALVEELKAVNIQIVQYTGVLRKISQG